MLYFAIAFYSLIMILSIYKGIQLNRQFRRRKEKSNKKWLLEELIFKQASGVGFIFMSQLQCFSFITDNFILNFYAVIAFAAGFTLITLINYISLEIMPHKAEKLLLETYPEFSL